MANVITITDEVTNDSSVIAASAKAVKTAYDKADTAQSTATTAQNTANTALSTAQSAQNTANTANSVASNAGKTTEVALYKNSNYDQYLGGMYENRGIRPPNYGTWRVIAFKYDSGDLGEGIYEVAGGAYIGSPSDIELAIAIRIA